MKFADLSVGDNFSFIHLNEKQSTIMGVIWQKIPILSIKGLNGQTMTINCVSLDSDGKNFCLDYVVDEHEIFPQNHTFWFDIYLESVQGSRDEYITEILSDTTENAVKKYREETGDNSPDIFAAKREMF